MSDQSDSQNKSEEQVQLSEGTSPSSSYDEGSRSTRMPVKGLLPPRGVLKSRSKGSRLRKTHSKLDGVKYSTQQRGTATIASPVRIAYTVRNMIALRILVLKIPTVAMLCTSYPKISIHLTVISLKGIYVLSCRVAP